jgi:hypothetical protein
MEIADSSLFGVQADTETDTLLTGDLNQGQQPIGETPGNLLALSVSLLCGSSQV